MKHPHRTLIAHLLALGLACTGTLAAAQTTSTPPPAPTPATAAVPTSKLVATFAGLAGSTENASALVNGLRTGSDITLTSAPAAVTDPTAGGTVTFSPGTRPMGYGNIRIALSLARTQLASQGITNPTPDQLQGALVGMTAPDGTTTQGILQMRASGMGWGQIANTMGVKLGAVMSGKATIPAAGTTTAAGTTSAAGAAPASGARASGITTAAGTTVGGSQGAGKGVVTGTGVAGGNAYGRASASVTTAAGGMGGGNAYGRSLVTTGLGQGGAVAASGAVNAAGSRAGGAGAINGGGHGKGKI